MDPDSQSLMAGQRVPVRVKADNERTTLYVRRAAALRVATGTMGYKHREADLAKVKASLEAPNFLLKIIPHVDGTPRICELVEYHLEGIVLKGAWTGPAALCLTPHALAPVAELPVVEAVSAVHICADLSLGLGKVVYDYLRQPTQELLRTKEKSLAI